MYLLASLLLTASVSLALGYWSREIIEHLKALRIQVTALVKRDIPEQEPRKSSMVELPMTPSQRVIEEQNDLLRSLNREA